MCYQCIALTLIVLFAVAVNAATNIVPAPHPPWRQTKTMHLGDVMLPRRRQKVLRGVANSPPMQPSLRRQNSLQTRCYVVRTQHHQPTTPGAETIQTECPHHEWGNRIVIASARQNWWWYYFFLVDGKNCSWQLHEGHNVRMAGLGSNFRPKRQPRCRYRFSGKPISTYMSLTLARLCGEWRLVSGNYELVSKNYKARGASGGKRSSNSDLSYTCRRK